MKDIFSKYRDTLFYDETDFKHIILHPYHFSCGMDIVCTHGEGVLSTGIQSYRLHKGDELIFLSGTLMQLTEATKNFKVKLIGFRKELLDEVALQIDTTSLRYLQDSPLYTGRTSYTDISLWMDMARLIYGERDNKFRNCMERNFLQSFLMWICHFLPEKALSPENRYTRKQTLYHQFIASVHDKSTLQHEVSFYASELCISSRYLNSIVKDCSGGKTPKMLIDEQVIAEIKVMLRYSELSVTQIAEQLKFPDQSYLSRYFKRQTGYSPSDYRMGQL